MTILYSELLEKLKDIDEITLMELLEINSEELVDRFEDRIEDKMDSLAAALEDKPLEDDGSDGYL